jgi:hypothetical protein
MSKAQGDADWAFSCWLVNTETGDLAVRHALETEAGSSR